jgi:hypothetical protein
MIAFATVARDRTGSFYLWRERMKSALPSGTRSIVAVNGVQLLRDVTRCVPFVRTDERRTVTGFWALDRGCLALARATTGAPNRRIVLLARCSRELPSVFRPHFAAKCSS